MINWLKSHRKELTLSLVLLGCLFLVAPVLRLLDPSSGILDAGFVQLLLLAALKYLCAVILGWGSGMRLLFTSQAKYAESGDLRVDFARGENLPKIVLTACLALACFALALWTVNASF